MQNKIIRIRDQIFNEIKEIRRHIHKNPELSFKEEKTSRFICDKLDEYGIEYKTGLIDTGVLGSIEGNSPDGRIVALRADMDALPVDESTNLPFKSVHKGVMHACGHDIHMACLLGAAKILNEIKADFNGKVKLVFQPGEEKLPGGAHMMLEEGLFGDEHPDVVIAQHVDPSIEAGKAGFRSGKYMASADEIYITVKGRGGHAAMPEKIDDSVLAASNMIVELQQVVSRFAPPYVPTVLSFGKIIADGATNVIPNTVKIEGTFRTMNEDWREQAHKLIERIVKKCAEGAGLSVDVKIVKGYPCLINDVKITEYAKQFACDYLGEQNITPIDMQMLAEDFAYFSQIFPSTMYRLGVKGSGEKEAKTLHSPEFVADEEAIRVGIGLLSWLAISFLKDY